MPCPRRTRSTTAGLTILAMLAVAAAPAKNAAAFHHAIVFASDRAGDFELYVRLPNGDEVALTDNDVSDFDPRWSPDGTRIAWSQGDRTAMEIHVAEVELSDTTATIVAGSQRQVTTNTVLDIDPAWSPDGEALVVSRGADGNFGAEDLWLIDLTPSSDEPTSDPLPIGLPGDDGDTIVAAEIQLTNDPASDRDPWFSPDGSQLVFARGKSIDGGPYSPPSDLFVMSVAAAEVGGGPVRNLTAHLENAQWTREHRARWTTDAAGTERIVFAKDWGGNHASTIWTIAPDGTNATQHTPGNRVATYPVLLDDGRIVYEGARGGGSDLYVLEGTSTSRLTKASGFNSSPDVRP